jgi:hypothetical protein
VELTYMMLLNNDKTFTPCQFKPRMNGGQPMTAVARAKAMMTHESVSLNLSPEERTQFDRLMSVLGTSQPETLALALVLLDWATERTLRGEQITSMSPDFKHYSRLKVTELDAIRPEYEAARPTAR